MKKRINIERLLLLLILIMQIVIAAGLYTKNQKAVSESSELPHMSDDIQPQAVIYPEQPSHFGFKEFEVINNHMNSMFERAMSEFEYMKTLIDVDDIWYAMPATPAMDMRETEDSYTIAYNLPGISPKDIIVRLNGRELSILSPSYGSEVNISVLLPGPVKDSNSARSIFTNGVLTVNVPKDRKSEDNKDNDSETIGL